MTRVCVLLLATLLTALHGADNWIDISATQTATLGKQPWPTGCAGVVVNRLNGDVMVNYIGFGLWKSSDKGKTWARLDDGVISGRGECGWSVQVDQDDPKRVAVFSLDGTAGYTVDGKTWKKFAGMGRNWDYGSIDWASPEAKVIFAGRHESKGEVYKSIDGGSSWVKLTALIDPGPKKDTCMIGTMDTNTFIYSFDTSGIMRSTDQGGTWTKVADFVPRSKVPVLFKNVHYLCTSKGLISSKDKGATWAVQGEEVDIWQGPFFGVDEKTMVSAGPKGVYKTTDAGGKWTKISDPRPNVDKSYTFSVKWFGTYAWDPVNDIIYTTAMANPAFKNELGAAKEK